MIYCVELAFSDPARQGEWSAWYSSHLGVLLSVPGFSTAQRFESVRACRAPFLATYSVTSAAVFDSAPYRQRGGRASPGQWVPLMINWDRNVFDGLREMPAVKADEYLVVLDGALDRHPALPVTLQVLQCVGLDRTVQTRGIAVLPAAQVDSALPLANEHLRIYRPLTAQLRAAS